VIVKSLCNTCLQPFELLLQASDVDLVKQIADEEGHTAPCPRAHCEGRINLVGDPVINEMRGKLRDPIHITGKQLYQAAHGMALPDELPKSAEAIKALLMAHRVVEVDVQEVDDRFYMHEIMLENGVCVHLSGGPRGAQVLKVTREGPRGTEHPR
jgi:hypothetical protein